MKMPLGWAKEDVYKRQVEQLLQLCRLDAKVVRFHAQEHAARQLLREAARGLAPLCACLLYTSWTKLLLRRCTKNCSRFEKEITLCWREVCRRICPNSFTATF